MGNNVIKGGITGGGFSINTEVLQTDIRAILELDSDKVFNIHQEHADNGVQSGYVGSQKNFDTSILEQYINQLKAENEFLKNLIQKKE